VRTDLEILAYPTALIEMARLATERLDQLSREHEEAAARAVPETERPLPEDMRHEMLAEQAAGAL
jgi:hypothetical protein